jgi:hypothetical protein
MLRLRPLTQLFIVLGVVSALPLWVFPYQPMPDHGNHLAAVSILRHLHDPAWDFERYYQPSLGLVPYWGFYAPAYLLSWIMPLALANRLILSFCVVGMPLGFALLARRLGRSPALAIFAFPLAWNYSFVVGFSSYAVGLALLPFVLVWFIDFCDRPGWLRGVAVAAAGCALYLCHMLPWGAYLGTAGLIGISRPPLTRRAFAQRLALWSPPVLFAYLVTRLSDHVNMSTVAKGGWAGDFPSLRQRLVQFNDYVLGNCRGREDDWFALLLLVGFVLLRATAPWKRPRLADLGAVAGFLTAAVAYLVLPLRLTRPAEWYGINTRFAVMAALFLALCVPGAIVSWRRWLLAPVVAAALLVPADVLYHWHQLHRDFISGYHDLSDLPERGARVLFVINGRQPSSSRASFPHGPTHQAFHGGYMPWNFDQNFPIRYKVRFPAVHFWTFEFNWDKHARYYDYVFGYHMNPEAAFGAHPVTRVKDSGGWTLWKLPGPRVDTPPRPPYPFGWEYQ